LERDKYKILTKVLGRSYRSGEERLFICPYCKHHKKKLSVNIDKDCYKCWICDASGTSIRRIVRRYGSFHDIQDWDTLDGKVEISAFDALFADLDEEEVEETVDLPQEFVSLANNNLSIMTSPARKYLLDRGITKKEIVRWKIGCCMEGDYQGRVVVPSFNHDGEVNYFIARSYGKEYPKYKNPPASRDIVFNHLYIDWDEDLILVEGVFDAIVSGPNSVPLLGSTFRDGSKLFQQIVKNDTPVFLALDPDARKKETRILKKLLEYGVEVYKVDVSGYEDVGSMTASEFQKRKENASFISNDDYLLYQMEN